MRSQYFSIIAAVGVVSAFDHPVIRQSAFLWGIEQPLLAAPAITPVPVPNALQKRIASTTIDEDAICGYAFGNASLPIICDGDSECGFDSDYKAFGCCSQYYVGRDGSSTLTNCDIQTKCYDSTAFSSCGAACQANTFNGWCTSAAEPYCVTAIESGYVSFACDSVRATVTLLASALNTATTVPVAPTSRNAVISSSATVVASSIKPSSTATLVLQSSASSVAPLNAASSSTGASTVPFSKTQASATDTSNTASARPSNVVVIGSGHAIRPAAALIATAGTMLLLVSGMVI